MAKKANGPIISAFKLGFGAGLGLLLANVLFILVGMALFVPGLIMYSKEKKKAEGEKSTTKVVFAFILMGVGCVIGLGLGAGVLFENIASEF